MPPKKPAKNKGLLLVGNWPNNPHHISGIRGLYSPGFPTPVGGPGEVGLEKAKEVDKDPNCPLKLVDMTATEAKQARAAIKQHRTGGGGNLADAMRQPGLTGEVAREEAVEASGGSD